MSKQKYVKLNSNSSQVDLLVIKLMSEPEKVDSLLEGLDDIARRYNCELGLPTWATDEAFRMRLAILEWLKAVITSADTIKPR